MKKIITSVIFINCKDKNTDKDKNPIRNNEPNINGAPHVATNENNPPIENKKIIKKKLNKFEDIRDIFYETGEHLSKNNNNYYESFNKELTGYSDIKLHVYNNIKEKGFYPLNLNENFLSKDGSISFTDFIKKNHDKNFIFFFKNNHPKNELEEASKKFFEEFKNSKNCYWNSSFFSDLDILEKKKEGYIHEEIYTFEKMEDIKAFICKIFNLKKNDLINFMSLDKNFKESIFNLENFLNELKKKEVIFEVSYDKNKKYNPFEKRPIQEIIEASPIYREYKELFEITYK